MSNSVDNTSPRILIDNPSKSFSENIFDIQNLQLNRFSIDYLTGTTKLCFPYKMVCFSY